MTVCFFLIEQTTPIVRMDMVDSIHFTVDS